MLAVGRVLGARTWAGLAADGKLVAVAVEHAEQNIKSCQFWSSFADASG